ncbi:MAG: CRISPR system precrRNA processing endoribonuclease RAMP protein Cas6 [Aquificae bacterium]|nr:CRISPR system precrRNA processing endoribonuclease RAMP protein Cas6 [Aquificota bacterium]
MPLKVFLRLKLSEPIRKEFLTPDGIHGLFFSLLGKELASELHEAYGGAKPYSLHCGGLFTEGSTDELNLEVGLLDDRLTAPVLSDLYLKRGKNLFTFRGKKIRVEALVRVLPSWIKTYEELVEDGRLYPKVGVRFLKPSTFRRNSVDLPFPLPELVFKSLLKRWLAFSPVRPEVDLRNFYDRVEVERYSLRTRKVVLASGGKLTAFEGSVVYNLTKVGDERALRWFSTLLRYALWAGVGRKTTMGLGKVKITPLNGNAGGGPRRGPQDDSPPDV